MRVIPAHIRTRFDLCTGCRLCQMACSFRQLNGYHPDRSVLTITARHENLYHHPEVCAQCDHPYCANVCPVGAIERDPKTLALGVDPKTCVGCGLCEKYCPVGMIRLDPESQKAVKCDLCQGRPACVKACPTGALQFLPPIELKKDGCDG